MTCESGHRCCKRTARHEHFRDPDDCLRCLATPKCDCAEGEAEARRMFMAFDPATVEGRSRQWRRMMGTLTGPCPECGRSS